MYKIDKESQVFTIVRGDSAEFGIDLWELDDNNNKVPYELQDGDSLKFTVKTSTKTKDVVFQKEGQEITIDPEDTEDLKYGTYKYDVEFTGADGYVDTIIRPKDFVVAEEVTF
nr:hypothetical protein [Clostridia bacterium]